MSKAITLFAGFLIGAVAFFIGLGFAGSERAGGVTIDDEYFEGAVYSDGVNMIDGGEFVGPIDTTSAADFDSTVSVAGATTLSGTLTYLEKTTSLTGSTTLTRADSGTTIVWNTSGGTTTLPAVATATGTVLRFVVGSALTTYNAEIKSAEGDNIEGSMIIAGAVVDCDASDRIYVLIDGENLGDFVELRSNGQKWFVTQSNALTTGKLLCDG